MWRNNETALTDSPSRTRRLNINRKSIFSRIRTNCFFNIYIYIYANNRITIGLTGFCFIMWTVILSFSSVYFTSCFNAIWFPFHWFLNMTSLHGNIHTQIIYMYMYICTCICVYMYMCVYVYIRVYVYIHTYIHTYIHAYMHTYMHTCIHAYMHTCIHTCIHWLKVCIYSHTRGVKLGLGLGFMQTSQVLPH